MANRKSGPADQRQVLDRLLRESKALRQRSDELAAEVNALRERIEGNGRPAERRRRPRKGGK